MRKLCPQILKLYAWEPSFQNLVGGIRKKEIKILKEMGYLAAGTSFIWACAPFVVSLVRLTPSFEDSFNHMLSCVPGNNRLVLVCCVK